MNQLYTLSYTLGCLANFIPLAMIFIIMLIYKKMSVQEKRKFCCAIIAVFGIVQIFLLIMLGVEYRSVYVSYQEGNYESVYGTVELFETNSGAEQFEVDEVKFKYSETHMMLGYNKIKENGGVVQGNGQNVRIDYIRYSGRNVIVAIYQMQ